ncbi:membrane protein insertase YidC [Microbacterium schleiferi]|uniref:Membrane protein insertase YidC n=1 Tax=Microbacterium schleiferi TaxID=69362 RepID=A0A7S8MW62_9MICO|nr:membrane protein insertase YidC [Microbacterium schleiferi]QPE04324.1 membrane protein insertase YidC [Microbacterium schleiferi]
MDLFAFPPLTALLDTAYRVLMGVSDLLTPLAGAASAALAIAVITLLVRAALIPTGISQARSEQVRTRLAPRLREIQRRFRKNPERMQREMMQLYRDEKTSPLAGILPALIQAPIVGLIYAVFLHPTVAGHPNDLLTEELLGVPLGARLVGSLGELSVEVAVVFGILIVLMAVVAEVTRRVFRPAIPPEPDSSPLASGGVQRVLGFLPYLTVVFAAFVPLAAAIYLAVTVTWTLGQRWILRRIYPLA